MPGFPYFTIIYIVLSIVFIYYTFTGLIFVLSQLCGLYTPAYKEGFSDEDEGALTRSYYASLTKRAAAVSKRADAASQLCETIRDKHNGLDGDICDVTRQIDDGILQNYASNVPEGEYEMPADVQKQRAADRKKRGELYVKAQRTKFSEMNDNKPLLECFSDETDALLADLNDSINSTDETVTNLEKDLESLRKELSTTRLDTYYTTLGYNNKYIKDLVKTMQATHEGFDVPGTPGDRVNKLEMRVTIVEKTLNELSTTTQKFVDVTKLQSTQLKQTKAIAK